MKINKNFRHLSPGPLAGIVSYYGKSGPSYRITFIKRLHESLRYELLEQKLPISPGLNKLLNWLAKTDLRGGLVVHPIVNYSCERNMLEETETEKTIDFLFVIGNFFIWWGAGPLATSVCWAVLF